MIGTGQIKDEIVPIEDLKWKIIAGRREANKAKFNILSSSDVILGYKTVSDKYKFVWFRNFSFNFI